MHVLVTNDFPPKTGGIQSYLYELWRRLDPARFVVVTHEDGSESIAIHSTGILGVSWDHRAVDGAYVSSFLARVSDLLTTRDWDAEL